VIVHATADLSPDCQVGENTQIWQHVQVREGASIGANCILGKGVYVDTDVLVGNNCKLENGASVYRPAVLEDGVFIGPGVIVTNDRLPRAVNPDGTLKGPEDWKPIPVLVRQGASVGAGSVVLPGVTIGRWAMVGAGAVVRHDIPDHGLVVGNPARLIGLVCACGNRLAPDAVEGDRVCPACARQTGSGG